MVINIISIRKVEVGESTYPPAVVAMLVLSICQMFWLLSYFIMSGKGALWKASTAAATLLIWACFNFGEWDETRRRSAISIISHLSVAADRDRMLPHFHSPSSGLGSVDAVGSLCPDIGLSLMNRPGAIVAVTVLRYHNRYCGASNTIRSDCAGVLRVSPHVVLVFFFNAASGRIGWLRRTR
jgi:hypothetical protein